MFKSWFAKEKHTGLFVLMLIAGIGGLIPAFILTVEKFHLLESPDAVLSCSINVVLNCASVMKTWQASVFGFPNSLIGLIGFSVVITVAVSYLAGARMKRWYWLTAQVFYLLGAIFAYWLFFNSVYAIQVLCPWCLFVTFFTTILLATITHYNLKENNFQLPRKLHERAMKFIENGVLTLVTVSWILVLAALVILKFGESLWG